MIRENSIFMVYIFVFVLREFVSIFLLCRRKEDGSEISVGKNNIVLRGCLIRNTEWVEGMVVYAGTMLSRNYTAPGNYCMD